MVKTVSPTPLLLLSIAPHCPSASSAIANPVEALQEEQLTHVRPAAFHANVILAVWQDGDLVAVVLDSSARFWREKARPSNREAPPSSVSRDPKLPPKTLSAISRQASLGQTRRLTRALIG